MDEQPKKDIEILSSDDQKIRAVGEILTNDSSRKILQLLFTEELSATQIVQKTGISLQLAKYHIDKMLSFGIIKISKVEKNSKNHDMNFYTATKAGIVIVPTEISERAKQSKMLSRSFSMIFRFLGVAAAAVISWLILAKNSTDIPMRGEIQNTVEPLQIVIPAIIIASGIIIEISIRRGKNKNQIQKVP